MLELPEIPEDAPELTPKEAKAVEAKAHEVALEAKGKEALKHMPFPRLRTNQRLVAAWLLTLKDLKAFYDKHIKSSRHSVQVFTVERGAEVNAGAIQGRDFEAFVAKLAGAFCGSRDSDEIHELIAITWGLRVPATVTPFVSKEPKELQYINQAVRRAKIPTKGDVAIAAVEAIGNGGSSEMEGAYNEAYATTYNEEEARIRSDKRRNERVARTQRKRGDADDEGEEKPGGTIKKIAGALQRFKR